MNDELYRLLDMITYSASLWENGLATIPAMDMDPLIAWAWPHRAELPIEVALLLKNAAADVEYDEDNDAIEVYLVPEELVLDVARLLEEVTNATD